MKLHKLLIMCFCVVLGLSSCNIVKHNVHKPVRGYLKLNMDNFEHLGDTEISVKYNQYIGFIRVIETINNKPYDKQVIHRTNYVGGTGISNASSGCSNAVLSRALYKVFDEYPDADYIFISNEKSQITRLFLGSEVAVSAKVKAYKLK